MYFAYGEFLSLANIDSVASPKALARIKDAAEELQRRRARALEEQSNKAPAPGTDAVAATPPIASALIDPMLLDLDNRASIPSPPPEQP